MTANARKATTYQGQHPMKDGAAPATNGANASQNGFHDGETDKEINGTKLSSLIQQNLDAAKANGSHTIGHDHPGDVTTPASLSLDATKGGRKNLSNNYWDQYLAGLPQCHFPAMAGRQGATKTFASQPVDVDIAQLQTWCDAADVELGAALQAAWAILLQGYTLMEDVCFGYTSSQHSLTKNGASHTQSSRVDQPLICRVTYQGSERFTDIIERLQSHMEATRGHHLTSADHDKTMFGEKPSFNTLLSVSHLGQEAIQEQERLNGSSGAVSVPEYDITLQIDTSRDITHTSITYSTKLMSELDAQRLARSLRKVLETMIEAPATKISDFHVVSPDDIDLTAYRNLPPSTENCTHLMIAEQIRQRPDDEAVASWDKTLTYRELGSLTSILATRLQQAGIGPGTYVAFCFPKSIWAVLSIIAVQMTGAAFIPLDPKAPPARWRDILTSVGATMAVCAAEFETRLQAVVDTTVVVNEDFITKPDTHQQIPQATVSPQDPSFIIFTSGSTGKPKGILMEHRTLCSLSNGHTKHLNVGPGTRVFQFSAYTFDAGIMEVLLTLMRGGCVCVPSEHDRLNDLAGVMTRLKANWIFLTPSIAEFLSPEDVPYLKLMAVGGEIISPQLVARWRDAVELHGVYGPTEVAICAANDDIGFSQAPTSLGRPISVAFWIVDPTNTTRLVPDGCIGELLIQGPLLARGYVSAEERVKKNWITEPARLPRGIPSAKAYLTGDLVRRHPNGTVEIIGRKDSQVKIRGQRTELGEIETRILAMLPADMRAVVEVVPGEDRSLDSLTALFWYTAGSYAQRSTVGVLPTVSEEHRQLIARVDSSLRSLLPSYMIPNNYLIFQGTPEQTHSGKVDRRQLLSTALATDLSQRRLFAPQAAHLERPTTPMELRLRDLWAHILHIEPEVIGKHDSFMGVGGDSVSAIRLVADAQRHSIGLSVSTIFDHPQLARMALAATDSVAGGSTETVEPFTLLPSNTDTQKLAELVRSQCELSASDQVQDVYPCSALQEGLMAIAAKKPGSYVARNVYRIRATEDISRFKAAWEATFEACGILRTRFALLESGRTVQAVVNGAVDWEPSTNNDLQSTLDALAGVSMGYGSRLCRFAMIEQHGCWYFVWMIHHALYDGWTIRIILDVLGQFYRGAEPPGLQSYNKFIEYVEDRETAETSDYWRDQLSGASQSTFPAAIGQKGSAGKSNVHKTSIPVDWPAKSSITKASVVRAAWAIVLARYCDSDDVCFGMTVSGRQAPIPEVNDIAGPMIATVPIRVRMDKQSLVSEYLQGIQKQSTGMIPHEQFGLQNIAKLGPDAEAGCNFSSLLVLQPADLINVGDESEGRVLFAGTTERELTQESMGDYFDYPLVLQVVIQEKSVDLIFVHDPDVVDAGRCDGISHHLGRVASQLLLSEDKSLDSISVAGQWDLEKAATWNGPDSETHMACLHDLVATNARSQPSQEAIYSTEGSLSYAQLEQHSDVLAEHLVALNVPAKSIVPICFEASRWAIVAMLGVLKAGCAFVPLDPAHPESRRTALAKEVGATVAVASTSAASSCHNIAGQVIELSESSLQSMALTTERYESNANRETSPNDTAYILFTSGSTGKPKGVVVEHSAICTSIINFGQKHQGQSSSRYLQFANYAFDASIYEIFLPLLFGGAVCVPSPAERMGNLSGFATESRATAAFLTPSYVRTLEPEQLPTLQWLALIGEAAAMDVVEKWRARVQLLNGYGPTECVVCCASHTYPATGPLDTAKTIGTKIHSNCWIVEPDNHDRLSPIGCAGELVIHGTSLARGYYKDSQKTANVFLDEAAWMPKEFYGPSHRLYKTGDLVQYNPDGSIEYLGRKDTQVKLRGQRLELGEIEYAIQAAVSRIKNTAVTLSSRESGDMLVAFVELENVSNAKNAMNDVLPADESIRVLLTEVDEKLKGTLPSYMVPSFFIPMRSLPFVTSMKMDRKKLQHLADTLPLDRLGLYSLTTQEKVAPETPREYMLQKLWASILNMAPSDIGRQDSFLQIGGDSISAIQLSSMARKEGIRLSVPTIFADARLSAMAAVSSTMETSQKSEDAAPAPFSLLKTKDIDATVVELRNHCKLTDTEIVQDAYPCTPLQEGLLALGVKHPGSYIAKHVYRLTKDTDLARFKAAWEKVYDMCENQRQRIVKIGSQSIQTLVGGDFEWEPTDKLSLQEFLEVAQNMTMSYGSKLCRSAIIHEPSGERYFVWVIHHAVFDGWGITLILNALRDAYQGITLPPFPPYSSFIRYASALDMKQAHQYWQQQLKDARPAEFPPLKPASSSAADKNQKVTRQMFRTINFPSLTKTSITKGTILRSAWAVVLARYGNTDDVCFGATASGRNAPVPGVERMAGTVIGTVPVRIRVDPKRPMFDFLQDVQDQAMQMIPYEQTGFQNISKISPELHHACQVSSLLIVQPERQVDIMAKAAASIMESASEDEYSVGDTVEGYFTFPIAIQCPVYNDHVVMDFTYDSSIVPEPQMEALCHHFETVVHQLLAQDARPLGDVSLTSSWDLERAIQFNQHVQEVVADDCIHDLISRWAVKHPDHEALFSTDGSLTYGELDTFSSRLACHLRQLGVELETVVPICFEKSIWTAVAMVGIMKAGGVFMPMDPSHPESRRQALIDQVDAKFLVASASVAELSKDMAETVVGVSPSLFAEFAIQPLDEIVTRPTPRNAAYILFTSGSTGQPKGIVVEHTAISSSILSHGKEFKLSTSSRVLQFASYVFDVSVSEILTTLVFGGTVCVPTADERMQEIAEFINRSRADTAMLTPSFVTTFTPDQVPGLKQLILGGEAPTKETLSRWQPHVRLLNGYAPAECCIYAITHTYESIEEVPTILGKGIHNNCWIVEADDHNRLAPVGCVGELIIQGNTIGRGYVNDEKRTAQAFIDSVAWIPREMQKPNHRFYKSGDLVKYDQNGELEYLGRKDTQVKLRGQRIELGEIEYNIKNILKEAKHVAVEVVRRGSREALIVFVSFTSTDEDRSTDTQKEMELTMPMNEHLKRRFETLGHELGARLPPYMVPGLFMPLRRMPFLSSMKVDRRQLRSLVDSLSVEEYAKLSLAKRQKQEPTTELELKLRELWAQVLMLEANQIGADDSFFQIGGDSLAAMQLSTLAQKSGLNLSVAKIFETPTLAASAKVAEQNKDQDPARNVVPFELLPLENIDSLREDAQKQLVLSSIGDIQDMFPCTHLQEGMMALSMRQPGAYVSSNIYRLAAGTDVALFRHAWEQTVLACDNLRTRFIVPLQSTTGKPLQVITKATPGWQDTTGDTLASFLKKDHLRDMGYTSSVCRYALVEGGNTTFFILTMHHAVYDLWTMHLVQQVLHQAYHNATQTALQPYADFVRFTLNLDLENNRQYWQKQLQGVNKTQYPRPLPDNASKLPSVRTSFEATLNFPETMRTNITKATLLRAAWAIVLGKYSDSDDVCFGTTVSGRLASLSGLASMLGPAISTVPIRTRLDPHQPVSKFLEQVQEHSSGMIAYEQYGLQNISKVSPEAREACDFSTLLVVQPVDQVASMSGSKTILIDQTHKQETAHLVQGDLQNYFNYPLVMNCLVSEQDVKLHVYYDSGLVNHIELVGLEHHMHRAIQQLMRQDEAPLGSISLMDQWDLDLALSSQPVIPESDTCTHTLIKRQVNLQVHKTAVQSWDGDLSYQHLYTLSSRLAQHLQSKGVGRGSVIPVSIPSSKWAVVSMIATQLAGAAFVFCDPSDEDLSISSLISITKSTILLTSEKTEGLVGVETIIVNDSTMDSAEGTISNNSTNVSPQDDSFVAFTDGSHGSRKPAIIQHQAACCAIQAYGLALGIHPGMAIKVFQGSPFTDHMAIINALATLAHGGCLCIEPDQTRQDSIGDAINKSKADIAYLSSTACDLSMVATPTLKMIALSNTPLSLETFDKLPQFVSKSSFYGLAEAPVCSRNAVVVPSSQPCNIGRPFAASLWVVEPSDISRMVPVGCVGELLVEGPVLARGYLNDAEATASAFVEDLDCLPGDHSRRALKTGHLVRRNHDGTFDFVGRKGDQKSQRGPAVNSELSDSKLQACLPKDMAGTVVNLKGSGGSMEAAVALLWHVGANAESADLTPMSEYSKAMEMIISNVASTLALSLPHYLIPDSYIYFNGSPSRLKSGKVNRRYLMAVANSVPIEQRKRINLTTATKETPTTPVEFKLRDLWSSVLSIPVNDIGKNDNFLQIGGDSISAIQLVTVARNHGLGLNVASIFRDPRLSEMAASAVISHGESTTAIEPFSLLPAASSDYTLHEVRQQCGLRKNDSVEDMYPCTPLQEGLLALTVKQPGSYIARNVFKLGKSIDSQAFMLAWERVVEMSANLRTRILLLDGATVQVVVNETIEWETTSDVDADSYTTRVTKPEMGYGSPLSRYTLVSGEYFVWTVHHAVYDGWTMQVLMRRLQSTYHRMQAPEIGSFANVIKYIADTDTDAARDYWDRELAGSSKTEFPVGVRDSSKPMAIFRKRFKVDGSELKSVTMATVARAAWAITLSSYTDADDVCFGTTVSGRQASIPGLAHTSGPTIASVPVRIKISKDQTVAQYLDSVQSQALDMVPYEQFGLQNIAKTNQNAQEACNFSSLLAIQPSRFSQGSQEDGAAVLEFPEGEGFESDDMADGYYTFPLVVQMMIHPEAVEFAIVYAPNLLSEYRIEAMTCHIEHVVRQLLADGDVPLRNVTVSGAWDLQQAISWNTEDLSPVDACVHDFFAKQVDEIPDKEALYSTDRSITYAELDRLSTLLAVHLRSIGVKTETVVPFCFEKSIWTVVSIFAILKAGGAFMPMDPSHPFNYRQGLVQQVGAILVLASPTTAKQCDGLGKTVLEVSESSSFWNQKHAGESLLSDKPTPANAAYVLFSSGSTGIPKGIVVEHAAFSASLTGHGRRFGFTRDSRVLQFSNYVFDVSVSEIITTLAWGGTLCVPSDTERLQRTAEFIAESRTNMATMTPAFIRTLTPSQVPTLEKLMSGGEAVTSDILDAWADSRTLINAYGPAEASVYSVTHTYNSSKEIAATIGRGVNNSVWVVDPEDPAKLAPIGCVGELVLQGPAIARGYVNDSKRTAELFSSQLGFLPESVIHQSRRFYRTGDLVQYHHPGQLVYVGRRDAQVKLRGQRIELGDIEYKIKKSEPVIEQAVVDVLRHDSLEALVTFVGFGGSESGSTLFQVNTETLRGLFSELSVKLSKLLPAHMVPTYFVPVTAMPQTSSGKIDRKTLKQRAASLSTDELLQYAVSQRASFRDCSTTTERRLRALWARTLNMEENGISVDDNFYDLGGDSIRIVTLMKAMQKEFEVQLGLSILNSRSTTIATMSDLIESRTDTPTGSVDLLKEINAITSSAWAKMTSKSDFKAVTSLPEQAVVFLTGGSGFLGTQLLRQLVAAPNVGRVVALVRAVSASQGLDKLTRTATIAGWWRAEYKNKIEAWPGDLESSRLGLNNDQWQRLCGKATQGNIDAIIHNGAVVNWNGDYEKLRKANVQSTVDMLKASIESPRTPKFVFISGGAQTNMNADLAEAAKDLSDNIGYSQTKFVAESVVYKIASSLSPAQNRFSVVKPGVVIGTAEEGVANLDDFVWRVVAAAAQLQLYPQDSTASWMAVSDAGSVAGGIIGQLMKDTIAPFVDVDGGLTTSNFWDLITASLPHPCMPISWEVWSKRALEHMAKVGEKHPLWPVQHFLGPFGSQKSVKMSDEATCTLQTALRKNVQYLVDVGFIQTKGLQVLMRADVLRRSNTGTPAPSR